MKGEIIMAITIAPWKCDEGDKVTFHFSKWAKEKGKAPQHGTIVEREEKFAIIHIADSEQKVRIHVSLINVTEAAFTAKRMKQVVYKKFSKPPTNDRRSKKKEMVNEVEGLGSFSYKKK